MSRVTQTANVGNELDSQGGINGTLTRVNLNRVQRMTEAVAERAAVLSQSLRGNVAGMRPEAHGAMGLVGLTGSDTDQARVSETARSSPAEEVEALHDVSGQIGLLALNATIEAARADRGISAGARPIWDLADQAKAVGDRIAETVECGRVVSIEVVASLVSLRTELEEVRALLLGAAAGEDHRNPVANDVPGCPSRAMASADRRN